MRARTNTTRHAWDQLMRIPQLELVAVVAVTVGCLTTAKLISRDESRCLSQMEQTESESLDEITCMERSLDLQNCNPCGTWCRR